MMNGQTAVIVQRRCTPDRHCSAPAATAAAAAPTPVVASHNGVTVDADVTSHCVSAAAEADVYSI